MPLTLVGQGEAELFETELFTFSFRNCVPFLDTSQHVRYRAGFGLDL